MARARNLKPGFFKNEELGECNPLVRLFFAGLWCEADRRGILEDRPKRLKAELMPYDDIDPDTALEELERRGFIERYEVDGTRCILIVNFERHQNPHRDEKASTLPAPCEHSANTVPTPDEHGSSTARTFNSPPTSSNSGANAPPTPPAGGESAPVRHPKKLDLRGFREWYAFYPRKQAPARAEAAWAKLKPDERQAALDAIQRQIHWPIFINAPPDKIPHPATWLNDRRWEDEEPQTISTLATVNGLSPPVRSGGAAKGGLTPAEIVAYGKQLQAREEANR